MLRAMANEPAVLTSLPISNIHPDPTQSRTTFDPAQIDDLAKSLAERGLINPIAVRQIVGSGADPHYEIMAGERRFRAAVKLGWTSIDCRIWPAETPPLETELLSLVENLQRVDLNPIEEARGFKQLTLPPYNLTNRDVAKELGKKEDYVSRSLSLLNFPPEIQESLAHAKLLPSHARILAKITNVEQQIAIASEAAKEGWSFRQLEEASKALAKEAKSSGVRHKDDLIEATLASFKDPLADVWQKLSSDASIKPEGDWDITYHDGSWYFRVANDRPMPKALLANWFTRVLAVLGDTSQDEKRQTEIMDRMSHSVDQGFDSLEEETQNARIPKNAQEMLELEALAKFGPSAVYRWVFGAHSINLKNLGENPTWEGIGVTNPKNAVHELVQTIKIMRAET